MPSNIAKGIAPISAATIWAISGNYLPVEWTVMLVSLVSAVAFVMAMRISSDRKVAAQAVATAK